MTSLFDVIAHEDADDQGKLRQASALAHQRVEDRFGTFVRKGSVEDQGARFDLVHSDLVQVVATACAQVGYGSPEQIERVLGSIKRNFISEPEARKVSSTIHEARKPRMCPYHSEVTDISLAQGEAQAGFNAMAQHAWTSQHCQGADYKGERCKFKPAMTTQAYWDERAEKAEVRRQERAERLEQEQVQQVTELPVETEETPEEVPEPVVEVEEIHEHQEPSAIGEGVEESVEVPMAMAASTKTAASCGRCGEEGVKKGQECPNCGYTGGGEEDPVWGGSKESKTATPVTNLGGPSPKMDKSKWTPKSVPRLDADEDDGRWPTKREDVTKPIDLDQGTRFEPSELKEIGGQVTERQDVTEKGGPAKTDQGGTFGGGERSAVSSLLGRDQVREALSKFKRD